VDRQTALIGLAFIDVASGELRGGGTRMGGMGFPGYDADRRE